MKKFIIMSISVVTIIILFFAAELHSGKKETKVTAFNASLTYESKKEYAKAIEELTNIYEAEQGDYLVNLRLGWLYYCTADYQQSKTYYLKAVTINKKSVEALLGSAFPLAALSQWDSLKTTYKTVLELDPQNYTANLRLGQNSLILQDYKSAVKFLETAKNHFPGEYEVNSSLAWTYFYLGRKSDAHQLFINTLMLSPNDSLAQVGLKLLK